MENSIKSIQNEQSKKEEEMKTKLEERDKELHAAKVSLVSLIQPFRFCFELLYQSWLICHWQPSWCWYSPISYKCVQSQYLSFIERVVCRSLIAWSLLK